MLENLWRGVGPSKNANSPTNNWKNSPSHKRRLDDKIVTKLGVGNAVAPDGRKIAVGLYHPNTPSFG